MFWCACSCLRKRKGDFCEFALSPQTNVDESSWGFKERVFLTLFLPSYSGPKSEAELTKKRFVFDFCACLNPRYILLFC